MNPEILDASPSTQLVAENLLAQISCDKSRESPMILVIVMDKGVGNGVWTL
jgi:hypothetical protein